MDHAVYVALYLLEAPEPVKGTLPLMRVPWGTVP